VILAIDEASLYLQASSMAVWGPRGQSLVVRCDPSRSKTSFYGALNLKTGQVLAQQVEQMTAETSASYLETVLNDYPSVPLVLLWDRAPWHGGEKIRELQAANPRLELVVFPTAAPELNPQEHVWKATRPAVSHNHTQRRLPDLAKRFKAHLTSSTFQSSFLERYGWNIVCPRST
jgi:transposase